LREKGGEEKMGGIGKGRGGKEKRSSFEKSPWRKRARSRRKLDVAGRETCF